LALFGIDGERFLLLTVHANDDFREFVTELRAPSFDANRIFAFDEVELLEAGAAFGREHNFCRLVALRAAWADDEVLRTEPLFAELRRRGNGERLVENLVGGSEVLFEQNRLDGKYVADVVEAVANVIGGEVFGRLEVHTTEVADGVVVLGAI